MKNFTFPLVFILLSIVANSQNIITSTRIEKREFISYKYRDSLIHNTEKYHTDPDYDFLFGGNIGVSCSYSDEAFNFSFPVSLTLDYYIKKGYYLQVAPKYSWLFWWNEHYFTLPLHVRRRFSKRLSLYLGPSITWDIGYFKDLGISAGAYFHFGKNSSIILSAFTFTLYDYYIDYQYLPICISYNHYLFKK